MSIGRQYGKLLKSRWREDAPRTDPVAAHPRTPSSGHTSRDPASRADAYGCRRAPTSVPSPRSVTSGEVSAVEVSLFEVLAEWMGSPAYYTRYGGRQPARVGAQHATIAPYGPYDTADGRILLAVQNDREWRALCTVVLGLPAIATDARFASNSARVAHREELNELIAARLSTMETRAAGKLLDDADVANASINRIEDFLDHPVLAERGRWHEIPVPGGSVQALRPPAELAGVEPVMGAVPALGQHTEPILRELGRTGAMVADMRDRGVV
jgi:itaconate CoA-transferase